MKQLIADDNLKADEFYRKASEGATFLYSGDFQNAKQLLQAVTRRIDKNTKPIDPNSSLADQFHRYRQIQSHKAQLLSRLLIPIEKDLSISLKRAPDARLALREAISTTRGEAPEPFHLPLRELLGYIGAHEWRKKGVPVPHLESNIHPYYGVFSPLRGEYLDLINGAPLSQNFKTAFDIGTGTGVIAALLAKRGIQKIVATDLNDTALECARNNIARLGLTGRIDIVKVDLFPQGRADLIVCNPPWLPARPTSQLEYALYDENSNMLRGFLSGVAEHLNKDGEAWLILSDLAELLGLRQAGMLEDLIGQHNLEVIECLKSKPRHSKSMDIKNPLHFARSKEVTRLFRLKIKSQNF